MSRQRRKSGYIRTNNYHHIIPTSHNRHESDSSLSFSPFQYSISPENTSPNYPSSLPKSKPMHKTSHKITSNNNYSHKKISSHHHHKNQINQSQQEQIKQIKHPYKTKPIIPLAEEIKRKQNIKKKTNQPKKVTLAEAFSTNCTKLKQRLEQQREIFRKKQRNNKSSFQIKAQINNKNQPRKLLTQQKQNRGNNIPHHLAHQQKMLDFTNQHNNTIKPQKNQNNQSTCKSTSFWVPGCSTARNRPNLTPRQMYSQTLAKWKQLPQVKEKQKRQKEKIEMRMRKQKAKLHNIQVRKRITSKI